VQQQDTIILPLLPENISWLPPWRGLLCRLVEFGVAYVNRKYLLMMVRRNRNL